MQRRAKMEIFETIRREYAAGELIAGKKAARQEPVLDR
jgi:hypothetical protein